MKKYSLLAGLEWQDRVGGGVRGRRAIDRAFALNQRNLWRSRPAAEEDAQRRWAFSPPPRCVAWRALRLSGLQNPSVQWDRMVPIISSGEGREETKRFPRLRERGILPSAAVWRNEDSSYSHWYPMSGTELAPR